jgi:hypothetical protein
MSPRSPSRWGLILLACIASGCGTPVPVEYPPVTGRRVQAANITTVGAVPYRVGAYELVFVPGPGLAAARHARRAALLADLVGGHGQVRGFMEWGRPGEPTVIYAAGGWARQRDVEGEPLTVFELALNPLDVEGSRGVVADPVPPTVLAVRVVVHEASGEVTLTRRR